MAYKLKIKHNLGDSVVLPVTLTYDDPGQNLKPINISLKNSYATEYRLWDDIDDLDVNKIKIVESNMVINNITYKFDPKNIHITEAASGGESGGGSNPSGSGSGSGSNPSGGESGGGSNPSGGESGGGSNPSGGESGGESGGGSAPVINYPVAITYNINDNGIKVYSNGQYQTLNQSVTGKLFVPPMNTSISSLTIDNETYAMEEVTMIRPKENESDPDVTYTETYTVIPEEVLCMSSAIYEVSANYSNNTTETVSIETYDSNTTVPVPQNNDYALSYNVQDGELRLYENGYYRAMNTNVIGNLFQEINNETKEHLYYIRETSGRPPYLETPETDHTTTANGFTGANNITFPDLYGLRYIIVPIEYHYLKLSIYYPADSTYKYSKEIITFDSEIHISFKSDVKSITLDRSNQSTMVNQLPYGDLLKNYVDVSIGENVMSVNNTITADSVISALSFDTNLTPTVFIERQTIVTNEGQSTEYVFSRSTWERNTQTTVYVGYYGHIYDTMTVTITQTDQSKNYVRDVRIMPPKTYVGTTYTLRDFLKIYPSDAMFSDFILGGYNSMGTDDFRFSSLRTDYITVSKWDREEYPSNWNEFFDEYMTITPIQRGEGEVSCSWRTHGLIGGTESYVYVQDPIEGQGEDPTASRISATYNAGSGNDLILYSNGEYVINGSNVSGRLFDQNEESAIKSLSINNQTYQMMMQQQTINGTNVSRAMVVLSPSVFISSSETETENTINATYANNSKSAAKVKAYNNAYAQPVVSSRDCNLLYDVQKGSLRLYYDGHYKSNDGTASGNLIPDLNSETRDHNFYIEMGDNYTKLEYASGVETVGDFSGQKYVDIDIQSLIPDSPGGLRRIYVRYIENGSELPTNRNETKVKVWDSAIRVSFKTDINHTIEIDRSSNLSLKGQLDQYYHGDVLEDYVDINIVGTPILCSGVNDVNLDFFAESTGHYAVGVGTSSGKTYLNDAATNWQVSDVPTKLYVKSYGAIYDYIDIRIIQSTNFVTIRHMELKPPITMYMHNTYTLRSFLKFIPEDADFSDFMFKKPNTSIVTFVFQATTTGYLGIRRQSEYPTNWIDFLDNYIKINPLKTGTGIGIRFQYQTYSDIGGSVSSNNYIIKN